MRKQQAARTLALLTLMPLLFLTSCASIGTAYKHNNIKKLTPGMTEQAVISILGAEPIHRFDSQNGEYSLQWMHLRIGIGTGKASGVIIDFSSDNKMIRVADSDIDRTP